MMLSIIPAVHAAAPTKMTVANIALGSAKVAQDLQAAIKSGKADGSGIYADVDKNKAMPSSVTVGTNTNGITQEGFYIFANDGKMILTDKSKTGIYLEDGLYYYYVEGEIQFGAGLVQVDGSYYYIRSGGYAAIGEYYVSITNGLMPEGIYTFGEDGKMIL